MDQVRTLILEPRELWWEKNGIFNPAALEINDKIYLLYRAVGADHVSRFGLAVSDDGEIFHRLDEPVFEADPDNPLEHLGVEDPRATRIGKDIFITYTAASIYRGREASQITQLDPNTAPWRTRVMLLKTRDFRSYTRLGNILPNLDSKDAVIFPGIIQRRYWLFHRVIPSIYLSFSADIRRFPGGMQILKPQEKWEESRIGAACPPLKLAEGYLLFYHAMDTHHVYRLGAALLDPINPALVISRTREPLMSPVQSWEKLGPTNNVIFPTGGIIRGDQIWLYYGAADRVIGVTKIPIESILTKLNV